MRITFSPVFLRPDSLIYFKGEKRSNNMFSLIPAYSVGSKVVQPGAIPSQIGDSWDTAARNSEILSSQAGWKAGTGVFQRQNPQAQ